MKKVYIYWVSLGIWLLILAVIGIEEKIIFANGLLLMMLFILNELCDINDKTKN